MNWTILTLERMAHIIRKGERQSEEGRWWGCVCKDGVKQEKPRERLQEK